MKENNQIALDRINKCIKDKLTILILSELSLTALPPEIGKCNHLERVDLANNQFSVLPPEIGLCTKLEWIILEQGKIELLPENLRKLVTN